MMINYDDRWQGNYGIARYSEETKKHFSTSMFNYIEGSSEPVSARGILEWQVKMLPSLLSGKYLYSPSFTPVAGFGNRQIITIHDLIHLDIPDESSKFKTLYYNHVVKPVIKESPIVFTVSNYSKQKIVEWSGISSDKIFVTGNSVSNLFIQEGESFNFNFEYLLYVGNQKPHKNTGILIELLEEIPESIHLVMVGQISAENNELVKKMGLSSRVHSLTNVSDNELAQLYRGAIATVMPSKYEGFGIPVLESMACGTPVISAKATSLPEVGGEAALYFEADDLETLKNNVLSIYQKSDLRERLIIAGLSNVKSNSWQRISLSISNTIRDVLGL